MFIEHHSIAAVHLFCVCVCVFKAVSFMGAQTLAPPKSLPDPSPQPPLVVQLWNDLQCYSDTCRHVHTCTHSHSCDERDNTVTQLT